jgi:hypothetical protein
MDIASLLVGLALLILVGFILAHPFLERQGVREQRVGAAEAVLAERDQVLDALRDLDFDHATGKITDEDYTPQRARLVAQGVALLKQLDSTDSVAADPAAASRPVNGASRAGPEDEIERAVAARRKPRPGAGPAPARVESQIEAAVAARRRPASAAAARTCPQCSAAAGAEDRFCAKCGAALPQAVSPRPAACAECGAALGPNDLFCGGCGAKVPDRSAAEAA